MNTAKIKAYAPQAREDFINAVTQRANIYGIFSDDHIEPIEFKGDLAVINDRAFTKKEGKLREKLVSRVKKDGFRHVMRAYAYTWFNRFVALRYMEFHDYLDHGYRVLSNPGESDIPEILEHAADVDFPGLDKDKVIELRLAGNKDNELYRLLIVAQCNAMHDAMPFLFERIDSETELLLPDNLLHFDSIIRKMVTEINEKGWNDVEIIGWIYQFYISERKNEVIGKVVKSEDIPAATQLFTPNWIVKYMVQNTLGRMWLATYPDSPLKDKMEYYIEPAEQEPEVQKQLDAITPKKLNPEEITFLDPACGSGHILVEAYDVLKEIYLERGYRTRDIPRLILEKNLYGLDIDDRAAQLACFAVLMKARRDDRKILNRSGIKLNIMAIQEGKTSDDRNIELFFKGNEYESIRRDLKELVELFEKGKTFGSLITVPDHLSERMNETAKTVEEKTGKWLLQSDVQNLSALVKQTEILVKKYDCVVTNPPYMGGKGMNLVLKDFAKKYYPNSKSNFFAMFIERNLDMAMQKGMVAMITMQSWMFLSSFEKLRDNILNNDTIVSMIHLGPRAFDSIGGEVVSTTAFVIEIEHHEDLKGAYLRVIDGRNEAEKQAELKTKRNEPFYASAADFKKIPGSPIAYWVSKQIRNFFIKGQILETFADVRKGLTTSNDSCFLKVWHEVSFRNIALNCRNIDEFITTTKKWAPINKGGAFRKWFGNLEFVINWENNGYEIKNFKNENGKLRSRPQNINYSFFEGITWNAVGSNNFCCRYVPHGFMMNDVGPTIFHYTNKYFLISLMISKVGQEIFKVLCPTMKFEVGQIQNFPLYKNGINTNTLNKLVQQCIDISREEWDSRETSWDFTTNELLRHKTTNSIKDAYNTTYCTYRKDQFFKLHSNEEELNRIFIDIYDLAEELTPDIPLEDITILKDESEIKDGELLFKKETLVKQFVSYAVGCMFGRYSPDNPGLILANQGETIDDFKEKVSDATFMPDDDNIIPILDDEYFTDDIVGRFKEFLKATFGADSLAENLEFIAGALSKSKKSGGSPEKVIRDYFLKDFFKDHLKTYKKRPIYWLFSSGKQKAFECLVYLHRYNESTLSRMRSAYVTPLQGNFNARIEFLEQEKDAAATASVQRKIQKEIDILKKKRGELSAFDDELRHYADMKISLDLDDGVKVNYDKFGNLLAEKKAITGKK